MPLDNRKKEAAQAAAAAMPKAEAPTPRLTTPRVTEPEEEAPERFPGLSYILERYQIEYVVERYPLLAGDVDICAALTTMRNAKRAIIARIKELSGE